MALLMMYEVGTLRKRVSVMKIREAILKDKSSVYYIKLL